MTFEEAIVKSIKSYFKGVEPSELMKASSKKSKYTKKYFDSVGEEFGIEPIDLKKKKEDKKGKGPKRGY